MTVSSDPLLWEAAALLAASAVALLRPACPAWWSRAWRALARAIDPLARRTALAVAACALAGGGASAAVALLVEWPEPRVHDEFCYLLAADTFARGRLTNPPHPCWESFETFHVIQHPTYSSKYPPGQGLILAAGQVLAGEPLAGVWLSVALMCGAIVWMLRAWVPPRWALVGGLIAAARIAASYWGQSYWGGALAAAGGALALGALRRVAQHGRGRDGALLGAGLVVLAATRPFEGLVLALPLAVVFLAWTARRIRVGAPVRRVWAGGAVVLAIGAGFFALHDRAVTGNALRVPYLEHDEAYAAAPRFLFGSIERVPTYRNDAMRELWTDWTIRQLRRQTTPSGFLREVGERLRRSWLFFLTIALSVPLLFLPRVLRDPWMRLAALCCVLVFGASLFIIFHWQHYLAPAFPPLLALVVGGLRVLGSRGRRVPIGRGIVVGILAVTAATGVAQALTRARPEWRFEERRAKVLSRLEARGEPALVLVRYEKGHSPHEEWVYNGADVDTQTVVWARDLGPGRNAALLAHFRDRRVVEVVVGAERDPPRIHVRRAKARD
jgi:hypothetical protein